MSTTLGGGDRLKHLEAKKRIYYAIAIQKIIRGKLIRLRMARGSITFFNKNSRQEGEADGEEEEEGGEEDVDDVGRSPASAIIAAADGSTEAFIWPSCATDDYSSPLWPKLDASISDNQVVKDLVMAKELKIRAITWNLCGEQPPVDVADVNRMVMPVDKYHMYLIGTEECERSIAQSAVITSKKAWESYLTTVLGSQYVPLRAHTLQAIHMIVCVHKALLPLISCSASAAVPTGLGQTLGNKGGVGVYLDILGTSLLVVNCHLAAHQNSVKERNADFNKINERLPMLLDKKLSAIRSTSRARASVDALDNASRGGDGSDTNTNFSGSSPLDPNQTLPNTPQASSNNNNVDINNKNKNNSGSNSNNNNSSSNNSNSSSSSNKETAASFADRVVFMGDMNYRIRGNRKAVMFLLEKSMHAALLSNDQLIACMKRGDIPPEYVEHALNFKPTYKFDLNSDLYDTGRKKRLPAWTDRILYVNRGIKCQSYSADFSLKTSDHRPVMATFIVKLNESTVLSELSRKYLSSSSSNAALGANERQIGEHQFVSESQVCTIS